MATELYVRAIAHIKWLPVQKYVAGQLINKQTLLNVLYRFSLHGHIQDQFHLQKRPVSKESQIQVSYTAIWGKTELAGWLARENTHLWVNTQIVTSYGS